MRKSRVPVLLSVVFWLSFQAASLGAQEWDDWDFHADLYARGDQTFTITVGTVFPTVFLDGNGNRVEGLPGNFSPLVGGTISLAYNHFLGANLFVGGEGGFSFHYTVGRNTLFIVPVGLRAGWQFVLGSFEFPISAAFGVARHGYMNTSHWGMFMRGGVSAFYRFSPGWSFGLNADWSWFPQRTREDGDRTPGRDVHGHILGLTLSARYHF